MSDQSSKFQKSSAKKKYDATHDGVMSEFDNEHKRRVSELEAILDKSTDFLDAKDIENIKKILSKLSSKLLDELRQALINKQMNKLRINDVLHEDSEAA